MNSKMKDCFAPHTLMHSLFGLGLGIVLINLIPSLGNLWIGLVLIVAALLADMMRK